MGTHEVRVEHMSGDAFALDIRGHRVVVDQPNEAGGADLGPTPTELFVGSLAACVGFYAERYLRRHDLLAEGLSVEGSFAMSAGRPARVGYIDLRVILPERIPEERRRALERVVEHCTVHESIRIGPGVRTRVVEPEAAAA